MTKTVRAVDRENGHDGSPAQHRRSSSHGMNSRKNSLRLTHRPSHIPAVHHLPRRAAAQHRVNGSISRKVNSDVTATVVKGAELMMRAPHPTNRRRVIGN